jgi:UDP-N-acetylglucosamine 1-carboxyvinyltransferase
MRARTLEEVMRIQVEGKHPLNGQYRPSGSTNAAVHLLVASLLTESPVTLHNFPRTTSTQSIMQQAEGLGAQIEQNGDNTLKIHTPQIIKRSVTSEGTNSLLFLAPVLVRRQYARMEIDFPLNRIRTHLEALRDLGLDVVTADGAIECKAAQWGYRDIVLSQTSVTATALMMMLSACFGQETVIYNAACEPQLQALANMLEMMGAQVQGIGSNLLRIFGKETLNGVETSIMPDHIEIASIATTAALSGGRVQINDVQQSDLRIIDKIYARLGLELDLDENVLFVPKQEALAVSNREEDVDASIETAPWPGFPSDLIATATVVATQARGTSLIHEKLYNNRLLFVDKLNAMGAQILLCDPHRAIVVGATPLRAIYMDSPDIRAGLGMLSAALIAEGTSTIDNAQVLGHFFENILQKLQLLGAHITVESG